MCVLEGMIKRTLAGIRVCQSESLTKIRVVWFGEDANGGVCCVCCLLFVVCLLFGVCCLLLGACSVMFVCLFVCLIVCLVVCLFV